MPRMILDKAVTMTYKAELNIKTGVFFSYFLNRSGRNKIRNIAQLWAVCPEGKEEPPCLVKLYQLAKYREESLSISSNLGLPAKNFRLWANSNSHNKYMLPMMEIYISFFSVSSDAFFSSLVT